MIAAPPKIVPVTESPFIIKYADNPNIERNKMNENMRAV